MNTSFRSIVAAAACVFAVPVVNAHMYMTNPPAFRYEGNPKATTIDYSIASPLTGISQYPCKGYQNDATGTDPVATWAAGSAQSFTLAGGAPHGGGSCQASISADNGVTWHVIKSYIGDCPTESGGTFDFTLPAAVPSGKVLFGWTWFNKVGNREMYMDCAAITVTGGGSGLDSSYPSPFVANLDGTCKTVEGYDVVFPDPGSVVETASSANPLAPTGDCGTSSSSSGSSAAASGSTGSTAIAAVGTTTTAAAADTTTAIAADTTTAVSADTTTAAAADTTSTPVYYSTSPAAADTTTSVAAAATSSSTTPTYNSGSNSNSNANPAVSYGNSTTTPATAATTTAAASYTSSTATTTTEAACSDEGAITCNSDGTWSMCGSGLLQNMGNVAAGMTCTNGTFTRARRSKRSERFEAYRRQEDVGAEVRRVA
ncbi:hypothetical protein RUND412_007580 [Rhizina undulata]